MDSAGAVNPKSKSIMISAGAGNPKSKSIMDSAGAGNPKSKSIMISAGAGNPKSKSIMDSAGAGNRKSKSIMDSAGAGNPKSKSVIDPSGAGYPKSKSGIDPSSAGFPKSKSVLYSSSSGFPKKRELPKLMACMTKNSLEAFRSRALFSLLMLDANGVQRRKLPLYQCLIRELREAGFADASAYLQDLIYDNVQLVNEDDIGIVVDLRKREDYLEHISDILQKAETEHEQDEPKKECLYLLNLALYYAEKEKGILWLAEKFFQASIAVSSQYLIDGGRLKAVCKYHYGKFLLDKFPGADPEEPFTLLTEVRDCAIGKDWPLYEANEDDEDEEVPTDTVFGSTALQLFRVLLNKARAVRKSDTPKAERLARLAERRAKDAGAINKTAEAIIEIGICQLMMNNLNNAQKTLERAFEIHERSQNIEGLCEVRMHMAAVMQRLGDHEAAAKLLTQMGASAMENGLRRMLGRALHLLGELHLRRERPELGTQHLAEAFLCFMGFHFESVANIIDIDQMKTTNDELDAIYGHTNEIFEEEAEQSRLMTAISAGQELMASYFNLLREAGGCAVAKIKTIEWKLSHSGWWIKKKYHDFVPCLCPAHKRTPLDVLWLQLAAKQLSSAMIISATTFGQEALGKASTLEDIRLRHSSYLDSEKYRSTHSHK